MTDMLESIRCLATKSCTLFEQQSQRNTTSPSGAKSLGDDPNITPLGAKSNGDPDAKPHWQWLQQRITGSDPSLPIFDGSSLDPKDHLIELEDDSMETAPDVRVYFHSVGFALQDDRSQLPPGDIEERTAWDAKPVRTGREYLKGARSRGIGYYVDPSRLVGLDLAANAPPGSAYYRMPVVAIVDDFYTHKLLANQSEGQFYVGNPPHHDDFGPPVTLTNIRINCWWIECLREGVVPGTTGFDQPIQLSYDDANPCLTRLYGFADHTSYCRCRIATGEMREDDYVDPELCAMVINRDWPEADDSSEGEEAPEPVDLFALQYTTARSWLMMPPLSEKEKKQRSKDEKKKAKQEKRERKKGQ